MIDFCRVFSDFEIAKFSRVTIKMFIGLIMFVGFVVQCGKKKKEKNTSSKGQLLEQSTMVQPTAGAVAGKAAVNRQNPQMSEMQKSGIGNGAEQVEGKPKTPGNGKNGKANSKKQSKKTKSEKSQSSNKEGAPLKPMDPTPSDPNDDPLQAQLIVLKAEECNKMDVTIEDFGNPAIHDRVSRAAATDMIFDPKGIKYKGNVDDGKDKKVMEDVEKDILAACEKHDAKFSRNGKVVKTVESEKSKVAPADQRVKMKPEGCVLFETRELLSELFGED